MEFKSMTLTKLDNKSRKQAIDTRSRAGRYLVETMNRFTSKEKHAEAKRIVENEYVPILDSFHVSRVTVTPQIPTTARIKDAVDGKTKSISFYQVHLNS